MTVTETNKALVRRFNTEFLEGASEAALYELVDPQFINRSVPPEFANGPEGLLRFMNMVMRPAFPGLRVEILEMIAEGDMVATRKFLHVTHLGEYMGLAATGRRISIQVMDFVRLRDGRYIEHWGLRDNHSVLQQLKHTPTNV